MKVVTYNIQFGLGKDGRNDLRRIADEVGGADIIGLQEVERNWEHSGHVDQPEQLSSLLPEYYWVYGPYFDVDASRKNPDGTIHNARRQFGNMVLSKTPILSKRLFPLPKTATTGHRNMAVGMLEAVVGQGEGKALRIYNIHLSAKSSKDRMTQIHQIRNTIARAPAQGSAWTGSSPDPLWQQDKKAPPMPDEFMLLGDFNHGVDAPEYNQLTLSNGNKNDLLDCWTLTGNPADKGATYFPADNPKNGSRIDFAFVDHKLRKRIRRTWIDNDAQGSDHQPFWVSIDDT